MLSRLFTHLKSFASRILPELSRRLKQWTTPLTETVVGGAVTDVTKSKPELIAENALLRHQLGILQRQVKRPQLTKATGWGCCSEPADCAGVLQRRRQRHRSPVRPRRSGRPSPPDLRKHRRLQSAFGCRCDARSRTPLSLAVRRRPCGPRQR